MNSKNSVKETDVRRYQLRRSQLRKAAERNYRILKDARNDYGETAGNSDDFKLITLTLRYWHKCYQAMDCLMILKDFYGELPSKIRYEIYGAIKNLRKVYNNSESPTGRDILDNAYISGNDKLRCLERALKYYVKIKHETKDAAHLNISQLIRCRLHVFIADHKYDWLEVPDITDFSEAQSKEHELSVDLDTRQLYELLSAEFRKQYKLLAYSVDDIIDASILCVQAQQRFDFNTMLVKAHFDKEINREREHTATEKAAG